MDLQVDIITKFQTSIIFLMIIDIMPGANLSRSQSQTKQISSPSEGGFLPLFSGKKLSNLQLNSELITK